MLRIALSALVFPLFCISPAWSAVSTGEDWELSRSLHGSAGEISVTGGTDRLTQSMGEANGLWRMSGASDVLLPGYLSSFAAAAEMLKKLTTLGDLTSAGTTMVLASNNSVQLKFNVDADAASLALPGALSVNVVQDSMGVPMAVPWPTTISYDALAQSAVIAPAAGNWDNGTLYELYASTDIADLDGNTRASIATFTFTTVRDPLVANVATFRAEPAITVPIPANTFNAPYLMMISSGTNTLAVRDANSKSLLLGPERTPVKVIEVDSFDAAGQPWGTPLAQNVTLTLPYSATNGVIDGTKLRSKTLSVWRLDENQSLWVKQSGASVDLAGGKVTYPTNHFSVYGLFGTLDTDVTDVYAFPVPFRPNVGNTARYGSWAEGIKFVNLPSEGAINIYTISGRRVRSLSINLRQQAWDARNTEGQQVASGLYLWEIRSGNNRKTGKLVIIK